MTRENSDKNLSGEEIQTYLACSLRYYFAHVARHPPDFIPITHLLDGAIRASIDHHYRTLADSRKSPSLEDIQAVFATTLTSELAETAVPVHFTRTLSSLERSLSMGRAMLEEFDRARHEERDVEIEGVGMRLSAPILDSRGAETGLDLVGVVDLLGRQEDGRLLAIGQRTSPTSYSLENLDDDLQMSATAFLLEANGYITPEEDLLCGYDVLRISRKPILELHFAWRLSQDRVRFLRIARAALQSIDRKTFIPHHGRHCLDCPHLTACDRW